MIPVFALFDSMYDPETAFGVKGDDAPFLPFLYVWPLGAMAENSANNGSVYEEFIASRPNSHRFHLECGENGMYFLAEAAQAELFTFFGKNKEKKGFFIKTPSEGALSVLARKLGKEEKPVALIAKAIQGESSLAPISGDQQKPSGGEPASPGVTGDVKPVQDAKKDPLSLGVHLAVLASYF